MKKPVFHGCATALMTPFTEKKEVDTDALLRLLDMQMENGVSAIVVCATTGECATLSDKEIEEIISISVERAAGKVPIIAGTGRNSTEKSLELSEMAEALGASALLMVTPYYNKTSQKGLIRHYTHVADRVKTPIIVYSVPSRTGMSILPETYGELAQHPMIFGAKEASGDISLIARAIAACPRDFVFYSGNDDQTAPIYSLGGAGVISTISNVVPREMAELCRAFENGEASRAAELQQKLLPVCDALFAETNPIPLKAAAEMLGICRGELRLPLIEASEKTKELIKKALQI